LFPQKYQEAMKKEVFANFFMIVRMPLEPEGWLKVSFSILLDFLVKHQKNASLQLSERQRPSHFPLDSAILTAMVLCNPRRLRLLNQRPHAIPPCARYPLTSLVGRGFETKREPCFQCSTLLHQLCDDRIQGAFTFINKKRLFERTLCERSGHLKSSCVGAEDAATFRREDAMLIWACGSLLRDRHLAGGVFAMVFEGD
jgi:hypothetical protein